MQFEYKTVAGPERGRKRKGCRTPSERVAATMQELIETEAAGGWEYLRTDLVPVEERAGIFSRRETRHCAVLVFRRERGATSDRAALSRKAAAIFSGEAPARRRSAGAEPRLGPAHAPAAPTLAMPPVPEQMPTQAAPAPTPEQLQAAVLAATPYSMNTHPGAHGAAPAPGHVPQAPPPAANPNEPPAQPSGLFTRKQDGNG